MGNFTVLQFAGAERVRPAYFSVQFGDLCHCKQKGNWSAGGEYQVNRERKIADKHLQRVKPPPLEIKPFSILNFLPFRLFPSKLSPLPFQQQILRLQMQGKRDDSLQVMLDDYCIR
jgi:hypothetical protein